jgi:hypothetical protein
MKNRIAKIAIILMSPCFGFSQISLDEAKKVLWQSNETLVVKPTSEILDFEFDTTTGKMIFSNSDFVKFLDIRFPVFVKVDFWEVGKEETGKQTFLNKETFFAVNKLAIKKLGCYQVAFYQSLDCLVIYHFLYTDFGVSPLQTQIVKGQKICD